MAGGTFITVGNARQPFDRLWRYVEHSLEGLPKPVYIQHGANPLPQNLVKKTNSFAFCDGERFQECLDSSALVIGHAGVGTILKASQRGKRVLVVPRLEEYGEHVDNHQLELALLLEAKELISLAGDTDSFARIVKDKVWTTPLQIEISPIASSCSDKKIIVVASVGGHLEAARIHCRNFISCNELAFLTDEIRPANDEIAVFPSCGSRLRFPFRVFQAFLWLRRNKYDLVLTTGAGVGAAFAVAAKLAGIDSIAVESITRVDGPGKWFRLCYFVGAELWRASWSEWEESPIAEATSKFQIVIKERK